MASTPRKVFFGYPRFRIATALLAALLNGLASSALAFGSGGHWAVGALAYDRLTPQARQQVERLIGDRDAFARSCNWADRVKSDPAYALTRPLHYVNIPPRKAYDEERDCRERNCLVAAIEDFSAVLSDLDRDAAVRSEALKFVCHFVGDLHQPLHVGYAHDRGGNRHLVPLGKKESINLHSAWDGLLPSLLVGEGWMDRSVPMVCGQDSQSSSPPWDAGRILEWTAHSRELLETEGLVYPAGNRLSPEYIGSAKGLLRRQLCLAGDRLAELLNGVLR